MSKFVILAAMGLTAAFSSGPADPPKVSARAEALDLLILGEKPVRLELRVEIDGRPVHAIWDETFAELLAFHDRNGDGSLDQTEAARLPSPFALRRVLWGQFAVFRGAAPPWAELDLNTDGKVGGDELADFYRRAGLGNVLVGVGKPPATDQLTDALLKRLDVNKDDRVEEAEWKAAAQTLRKLDANDDELIGPGELVAKVAYPGARGSILLTAPSPNGKTELATDALPLVVLPLRTADTHWATAVATRREQKQLPALTSEDLLALRKTPAAIAWRVKLGTRKKDEASVEPIGGKPPANGRLVHAAGKVRLELRADDGKLGELTKAASKRLAMLFAECDANTDKVLDTMELSPPKAGQFKQLLMIADRDGDGRLAEKEFRAWTALQEQIAKGHALLTVLDHGTGLFELLDADHDGSLSVRELRIAWGRLTAARCVTDGRFDRAKLPHQLIATVSRGHPRTALGEPRRSGPDWFLAMDRNRDGDISIKEWVGDLDVFHKLDGDSDGLLTSREAEEVSPQTIRKRI